jgi:hypothetical protein
VLDPSMSWQTYFPGSSTPQTLTPKDLYDCDKSKHVNAIVIDEAATWCGPCQDEATNTPTNFTGKWNGLGVAFVNLIADGDVNQTQGVAPTIAEVKWWRDQFQLTMIYVGLDDAEGKNANPPFVTKLGGFPSNFLVDPRTMKIVQTVAGEDPSFDDAVTTLANKNK